jgi:xanthine dehydrogenase molybdenum-binding subunit
LTSALKVVGKNIPRLDAYDKATGAAKFVGDIWHHGTLAAKILRSPYAHAKILKIDTRQAENMEGVRAILTHQDIPHIRLGEFTTDDAYALTDKARYVGDEVAAVAADSEEIAERALELIEVQYEQMTAALTPEEALKHGSMLIPPLEVSKSNLLIGNLSTMSREWGNIESGFQEADHVFQTTFHAAIVHTMPIETRACFAYWENSKLVIWVCAQSPFYYRRLISRVLGIPENTIKLVSPYVGGGFGGKITGNGKLAVIAALLAKTTERPVKLIYTRQEDFLSITRPATDVILKAGVKKDGTFTALHAKMTVAGGGYNWVIVPTGEQSLRGLLHCTNCKFEGVSVYTNSPPGGCLRGVQNTIMNATLNELIYTIAEKMKFRNPIDFIKKTRIHVGDDCSADDDRAGLALSSCGLDECLDKGAKAIDWHNKWKGWKTPVEINGSRRIGIGMCAVVHNSAQSFYSSGAIVKINIDGTADFFTPVTELGQGAVTTQAQVLSEASGIPLEDIHVVFADTEVTPVDLWGQIASSSATIRALAAERAGQDTKRQLLERAASELAVTPEALDIENGTIYIKAERKRSITIRSLMGKIELGAEPIVSRSTVSNIQWPQKVYNYGAHFALVEVDTLTGIVKVLKYVAAHDVGKALNPLIVEGQIQGGVALGLSLTLIEEVKFNKSGEPLNLSLTDYKILTSADYPEIIPVIIESNDPMGAYGAKGFGEAPNVGVPGCIINAIYNAIGIKFRDIPITPEKVLKALIEIENGVYQN